VEAAQLEEEIQLAVFLAGVWLRCHYFICF
jgi:hypothetical protein